MIASHGPDSASADSHQDFVGVRNGNRHLFDHNNLGSAETMDSCCSHCVLRIVRWIEVTRLSRARSRDLGDNPSAARLSEMIHAAGFRIDTAGREVIPAAVK